VVVRERWGGLSTPGVTSGVRTEIGVCGDFPYHHGGMVLASWMMVVGRVVNK